MINSLAPLLPLINTHFMDKRWNPIARQFFIQKTNLTFEDAIFTDDQVKLFSASLDGYNEQFKAVLEIKCPYVHENQAVSSTWTSFLTNPQLENIPQYYTGPKFNVNYIASKLNLLTF
ncbi:Restriction endonuclease type II-like [Candidatus Phytoplasma rubi]|uniref:Restriction endonuclease type II-like n=1 Tax=Candidatus Phytoplasma rubi TaxID=399025 RepID=A0ABY7BRB8_9MOLU|nr:Restriction endonuclease type II-like [Candidatus Phytoplasma rubi]